MNEEFSLLLQNYKTPKFDAKQFNQKLKVFISSKMIELRDVREFVAMILHQRGIEAWVFEANAGARPSRIENAALYELESADVYIGFFWQKYGEVTALEYRHARKMQKPCFIYIRDQNCQREKKLEDFLNTDIYDLNQGVTYDYFNSAQKLGNQVSEDIMAWLVRRHREMTAEIQKARISQDELALLQSEVNRLQKLSQIQLPRGTATDYLATQLKSWFLTMGYIFENHDIRTDNYFEWIINVPNRRGYDRILIHGIGHQAEIRDIISLKKTMKEFNTHEGWLITAQRVSQGARNIVLEDKNKDIFTYTFDGLLDEHANFSKYFDWLENEIKRHGIDKMYIPLACTMDEIDPVTKKKLGESRYNEVNGWIDGYIDRWLDDPSKEHISILGEFGTGKTWFALHYAWNILKQYREAKERGIERPRLPLVIPLRDYAKAVSVESLFSEFFFRKHEIPLPGYRAFEQLNRMGKLLLIFDGFDEMADRVDKQKMINNFWEFTRVLVPGGKAILTCRTEHFPDAKEGRALLNAELQASTAKLTGEPPQFEVVELEMFNDEQVREVLTRRTKPETVKKILEHPDLMDFARRPLMVEYILEALPDVEAGAPVDLSRIYLYAVHRKMDRDIQSKRTFTSLADKLYFLCELSWEMLSTDQMSLNYRLFPDRLRRLFGEAVSKQKDLDHWHYDMAGQTMLIRNADGDYSPAHRSLLEFFVAYKFVAELGVLAPDFTALARTQSYIDIKLPPKDYVWSEYFYRAMDKAGNVKLIAPLKTFVTEDPEKIENRKDVVSVGNLPRNALAFAAGMVSTEPGCLEKLCEMGWEKTDILARSALYILPLIKHQCSETLAKILVEKSEGRPLKSGVAWVSGELGVASEQVISALENTVKNLCEGGGATPSSWWESAFSLEKLGRFGPGKVRRGDEAISFLIENLPLRYSLEKARQNLLHTLLSTDPKKSIINQCDIVEIVKHESRINKTELFQQVLSLIDFSKNTIGKRSYYMVWLCGHFAIPESFDDIVKATKHPQNSVRNCACEALGKIGVASPMTIKALEDCLTDSYYRTRFHSAWSLGELGSFSSIPKLSNEIKVEEVKDVREEMIRVRDILANHPNCHSIID